MNNIVAVNNRTDIEAEIERIAALPYHHELVRNDDGRGLRALSSSADA